MLRGEFWFRLHSDQYRPQAATALASDKKEGVASRTIGTEQKKFVPELTVGNVRLKDVFMAGGSGPFFDIAHKVDAHIFCASIGSYAPSHHRQIKEGMGCYTGNPGLDYYLEFDLEKFCMEATNFCAVKFRDYEIVAKPVMYNDRQAPVSSDEMALGSASFEVAAFSKPSLYKIESEVRVLIIIKDLDTKSNPILKIRTPNANDFISAHGKFI